MFDIGFLELLICGVIALLVLGPERLPTAARAAGRWVGGARRMVSQFTSELDNQLKAEEFRKELRKAGDVGLDDVQKTVRGALDEAKKYEHMIMSDKSETDKQTATDHSIQGETTAALGENKPDEPDAAKKLSDKPS
ncbi:Sec-independent protein translocase protein TatB [Marinobacter sp. ANT_B65]|uniref:Sec-independent protein translocase protein TatB n=1 Tax=Marinobacter sp. ANT_B65 TaxID=2039467 RepID=UPI001D0D5978|nr:Sec-independent protein translocase protein TatB [Marinobacter sp. ANT_B65]